MFPSRSLHSARLLARRQAEGKNDLPGRATPTMARGMGWMGDTGASEQHRPRKVSRRACYGSSKVSRAGKAVPTMESRAELRIRRCRNALLVAGGAASR